MAKGLWLLLSTILRETAALPRFVVCVSGGARTLEHTVGRFAALLDRNPSTDFFFVLSLEDNRVLQNRPLIDSTHLIPVGRVSNRAVSNFRPRRRRFCSDAVRLALWILGYIFKRLFHFYPVLACFGAQRW
jgi:hypothetical protein